MSDTRVLLSRIAALRQRLEQTHGWAKQIPSSDSAGEPAPDRVQQLESQVAAGTRCDALLDRSFRQLEESAATPEAPALPRQLTARARRLLLQGHDLLTKLRGLAECFPSELDPTGSETVPDLGTWTGIDTADPLTGRYRDTAAMLDTALRTVQAYPDSPSVQLRLCDGLEAILGVVAERWTVLKALSEKRKNDALRVDRLADLLLKLADGKPADAAAFMELAEDLLREVGHSAPLRFLSPETLADARDQRGQIWLARAVACHSLTVAQVVARLVRHDPEMRSQPVEPVLAALVHDIGMLRVPVAIYVQATPLDGEQRRALEAHTRIGADLAARLLPSAGWLLEAVTSHHERYDGTGYPAGLREMQIAPLVRFLSVCDVYAAWCTPRPHRPAKEPRTALTDTLLLADKGALDRNYAERLLQLSFYPVGSVVELADGALGVVIASPVDHRDLAAPSRPVLTMLTDTRGQWLPLPRPLNLADAEGRTIVRSLMPAERRRLLGKRYPEYV
jgi:hypothetical protein